jgi:hypothetical protein
VSLGCVIRLSVVRLSVIRLSVTRLSVIRLSVIRLSVVRLSVIRLSAVGPSVVRLNVVAPSSLLFHSIYQVFNFSKRGKRKKSLYIISLSVLKAFCNFLSSGNSGGI